VGLLSGDGARPVEADTFDFWETLCRRAPGALEAARSEALTAVLAEAEQVVEADVLDRILGDVWNAWERSWSAGQPYYGPDAAGAVVDMLAIEGLDVEPHREALVAAFLATHEHADLFLVEGVAEVLDILSAHGVRLGIICDVGFIESRLLRRALERHEVLHRFQHWSFSDEVGVYKPDRRIFEHALAGLGGVAADRAAHVGDIRRTDVQGARAMGMLAIRFAGVNDDQRDEFPDGDVVIRSYDELPAVLGLTADRPGTC
jgi:putative hydrolase of the HAD superfamily